MERAVVGRNEGRGRSGPARRAIVERAPWEGGRWRDSSWRLVETKAQIGWRRAPHPVVTDNTGGVQDPTARARSADP